MPPLACEPAGWSINWRNLRRHIHKQARSSPGGARTGAALCASRFASIQVRLVCSLDCVAGIDAAEHLIEILGAAHNKVLPRFRPAIEEEASELSYFARALIRARIQAWPGVFDRPINDLNTILQAAPLPRRRKRHSRPANADCAAAGWMRVSAANRSYRSPTAAQLTTTATGQPRTGTPLWLVFRSCSAGLECRSRGTFERSGGNGWSTASSGNS
jgi:hypothetical protein